ncbi:hypothetical protein Hypma_000218 [Hypsizygus marmoreus]|uniref:Uncharacterized protein n=1 Tax=Hypsizygus marmoreus TaxID=39966 RepID=A0A369JFL9_HYPMA|nr:hypothetical protein Hypma_000218 [Hypsizygus marmoreus]
MGNKAFANYVDAMSGRDSSTVLRTKTSALWPPQAKMSFQSYRDVFWNSAIPRETHIQDNHGSLARQCRHTQFNFCTHDPLTVVFVLYHLARTTRMSDAMLVIRGAYFKAALKIVRVSDSFAILQQLLRWLFSERTECHCSCHSVRRRGRAL